MQSVWITWQIILSFRGTVILLSTAAIPIPYSYQLCTQFPLIFINTLYIFSRGFVRVHVCVVTFYLVSNTHLNVHKGVSCCGFAFHSFSGEYGVFVYLSEEAAIQILYNLKLKSLSEVRSYVVLLLQEFFTFSGYETLVRYMVDK